MKSKQDIQKSVSCSYSSFDNYGICQKCFTANFQECENEFFWACIKAASQMFSLNENFDFRCASCM